MNATDFSAEGSLIAVASSNALTVLDAGTGAILWQQIAPNVASYAVAFADDGKYLATAGQDGIIRLWGIP